VLLLFRRARRRVRRRRRRRRGVPLFEFELLDELARRAAGVVLLNLMDFLLLGGVFPLLRTTLPGPGEATMSRR
jgi:hypothetical protein